MFRKIFWLLQLMFSTAIAQSINATYVANLRASADKEKECGRALAALQSTTADYSTLASFYVESFKNDKPAMNTESTEKNTTAVACESFTLTLACPLNYIVTTISANYGRTDIKTCVEGWEQRFISNTRCNGQQTKAKAILAAACDGKNKCFVDASNAVFGDPCVYTYKYLTVDFKCSSKRVE